MVVVKFWGASGWVRKLTGLGLEVLWSLCSERNSVEGFGGPRRFQ